MTNSLVLLIVNNDGVMRILKTVELGRYVATSRRDRGLTQSELAEAIGTSRFWVIRAERGEPRIELGLVLRALRFLEVTVQLTASSVRAS